MALDGTEFSFSWAEERRPRVVADGPLATAVTELFGEHLELLPWEFAGEADGIYTFGHELVDGAMLDRLPGVRVVSNYGVGVDHIVLADAKERGIPVGNTPSVLDGATADMGFTLMLAAARRLIEGDHYARSPEFLVYNPGYMLGREVHSQTIGIVGLGAIGWQVAKRARAFDMPVVYHNRRPRPEAEVEFDAKYMNLDELLMASDFVMLCCPLTTETRGLIGKEALELMKPTAFLINIARGGVVDSDALAQALRDGQIAGAGIDVTDPEPLPRGHPLLETKNLTIAPHLGSATVQTRQAMAEVSVANLFRGLAGRELLSRVA